MISTAAGIESLMLNLTQEIQVRANLETTFAASARTTRAGE